MGKDGWSSWSASYTFLDGRLQHTIHPETDTLQVAVEMESGTLTMEMKDAGGTILFSESDIGTSSFEVNVPGKVVVTIQASRHKGSFAISSRSDGAVQTGQIFLYGEEHASDRKSVV